MGTQKRGDRRKVVPLRRLKWVAQGGKCYWCGQATMVPAGVDGYQPLRFNGLQAENRATLDHIIPHSQGGATNEVNCVMACRACNEKRGQEFNKGLMNHE